MNTASAEFARRVLAAPGFPDGEVRRRARLGAAAVFPSWEAYGRSLFGSSAVQAHDLLQRIRLVPPVLMPLRLKKLIDLGREPLHSDVDLRTYIGGFESTLPLYLSAFGSTRAASTDLGVAAGVQAAKAGIPMVIGENIVPMNGYRGGGHDTDTPSTQTLMDRIRAYTDHVAAGVGGVVVQQSTDDADLEVWNLVYSDPAVRPLVLTGRLGFELKVGQGAKPGLGGMTVLGGAAAARADEQYAVEPVFGSAGPYLRSASPGTFTEEILSRQIRLMRNNFPDARVWVKLFPGRDIASAVQLAWDAGADAVAVDGAEGGTGWAPTALLEHVGLPLGTCLTRIDRSPSDPTLLASGRMWEGSRVVKCLALGASAAGLGRAALLAADEDAEDGLLRLLDSIAFEIRLLVSALGKYAMTDLGREDIWLGE